jgi:hypothetical protein
MTVVITVTPCINEFEGLEFTLDEGMRGMRTGGEM